VDHGKGTLTAQISPGKSVVQCVLAGPDRRSPTAAACSLDVVDPVVDEENFVWGKTAPLFYLGEKLWLRFRPAKICGVVNCIELLSEAKLPPKKFARPCSRTVAK